MKTFKELRESLSESAAREMAKDVAGSYSSSARLYPSNKAGYDAKMMGASKTEFSAKRKNLGFMPTARKNWSKPTSNED